MTVGELKRILNEYWDNTEVRVAYQVNCEGELFWNSAEVEEIFCDPDTEALTIYPYMQED